ncbi:MAG TPA: hypothetical protein VHR86_10700, partial [Armatimonadota bacterium]|nr:hypothetical protein [Armatimonadota bacterium]
LCFPCRVGLWDVPAGSAVLDCGSVLLAGAGHAETEALARVGTRVLACEDPGMRAVQLRGADGAWYLLAVNFSAEETRCSLTLPEAASACDLVTAAPLPLVAGKLMLALDAGQAALARLTVPNRTN